MNAFDSIIGYDSLKEELQRIADTLKNLEVYEALGVSAPKGLLLHGEPGVGKTTMAKALVEASGREAFFCRKSKADGEFVDAIRETFDRAAETAPAIVFLDDMDKFSNDDSDHPNSDEYVTVQTCIDEVKDKNVFVLATANELRSLPRSLTRAGRFDRVIKIEAPCGDDAVRVVEHYLRRKKMAQDLDAKVIAEIMPGRTCADLETVVNEAGLLAGYRRSDRITMEHVLEACMTTVYNVPVSCAKASQDIDPESTQAASLIAWHEAGHAVIKEVLSPGCVSLLSARCRLGAHSGFTVYTPSAKRNTLEEQKWHIIASLGGRAALEVRFGLFDMGSGRDLDKAFQAARDLIENQCFGGFSLYCYREDSQKLKESQEAATAAAMEEYYRKAKEILCANLPFLEALAHELAKKGVLTAAEIRVIREGCSVAENAG